MRTELEAKQSSAYNIQRRELKSPGPCLNFYLADI